MYRNYGKLFVPRYTFLYFMPVSSKCWKRLLIKRLLEKKKRNFQFGIYCESKKYMVRILVIKSFRRAHHNCCNLKPVTSYSILS